MGQKWRWDQGRLTYFQFENLKEIAYCLSLLDGITINQKLIDPLRVNLMTATGLPFAPDSYRVWRNYKRVFECSYLASNINEKLYISDFCKKIVSDTNDTVDVDEYLSLFLPRFRFPFVAFNDYHKSDELIYPFCAVLKYLISMFMIGKRAVISLDEVFTLIIGNNCSGFEPVEHYIDLKKTSYQPTGDEYRQVREMLIFISQISILKWIKGALYLDITARDFDEFNGFQDLITPYYVQPKEKREDEFISITSFLQGNIVAPISLPTREVYEDEIFLEGKKSRVTHIKIERSPLLRRMYFSKHPKPICDMCTCDTQGRYPWTENILEVHHILPLSSTLIVTGDGTSFERCRRALSKLP
ncbi:hypothetical protein ACFJIV_28235 [Mucilaginibacter sp. UC70_90]